MPRFPTGAFKGLNGSEPLVLLVVGAIFLGAYVLYHALKSYNDQTTYKPSKSKWLDDPKDVATNLPQRTTAPNSQDAAISQAQAMTYIQPKKSVKPLYTDKNICPSCNQRVFHTLTVCPKCNTQLN